MPTRSGRTFSVGETSAPIDPNIQDTLNTLIDKIEKMDQQLQKVRDQVDVNCRDLATRLNRLETNWRRATEEEYSRNDSRSTRRERVQPYNTADADAQYIKSVSRCSFLRRVLGPPGLYIMAVGYVFSIMFAKGENLQKRV